MSQKMIAEVSNFIILCSNGVWEIALHMIFKNSVKSFSLKYISNFSFTLMTQKILYLASNSPRRMQILKEICKELDIVVRKFDEKT